MTKRMIAPLLFGLCGAAILIALGVWQIQRMGWKEAQLAAIEARIYAAPVPLPLAPDAVSDKYLPVTVSGRLVGPEIHVLSSTRFAGPGYRVISALDMGDRRILLDRGFVPEAEKDAPRPQGGQVSVVGNLHWPQETDGFTPKPDLKRNIWFAREVGAMARALDTEPVLVVVRETAQPQPDVTPVPVGTESIPNDHFQYALTWFSLAAVWLGMTAFLLWRMRQKTDRKAQR
ncbi:SURF1 family protein [Brevirhabdus sp.]|uniref:SURF1 family protein n=1 Tax=Brevirhabdus sp. TaxID=2004514 RepID=UPI004058F7DB